VAALAGALGDRLVRDEVIAVEPDGTVRAAAATSDYDRVIVCGGLETPRLSGLRLPVVESIHTRYAYRVRGEAPARLACLVDSRGAYGDPLPGNDRYAVGAPDGYVAQALPGLEPEPVEARTCWVTELSWGPDAFAVWEQDAVLAVAGSNLFKHAPLLGRELAAAALGDGLREELRPEASLGAV
jgi:sarcosine oxidase